MAATSAKVLLGAVAAILVGGCAGRPDGQAIAPPRPSTESTHHPGDPNIPATAVRAHVTRVVDGDTIVLSKIDVGYTDTRTAGRHARLIGVDTPEVFGGSQCFGYNASAFTKRTLEGRDVFVAFDVDRIDRYGRALVYVWGTDGEFFNGTLAAEGYALQLTVPPNVRYAELFTELARQARIANRGLWSQCR